MTSETRPEHGAQPSHHADLGEKGARIQGMFDKLAPRYDLMNRVMTLGQDQRWRRFVVERAELAEAGRVLDLASGTGDIALEFKRRLPEATVIAGDFSLGMMRHGITRPHAGQLHWIACDAMRLPFADNSFGAVTFGYLLRNVASIPTALAEVYRVLEPGGRVVCLDTTPPPPGILRPFIRTYLNHGLPLLGRLLSADASAYAYLSSSTQSFETAEDLADLFSEAGFQSVAFRHFMFRTVAIHWARRPG